MNHNDWRPHEILPIEPHGLVVEQVGTRRSRTMNSGAEQGKREEGKRALRKLRLRTYTGHWHGRLALIAMGNPDFLKPAFAVDRDSRGATEAME